MRTRWHARCFVPSVTYAFADFELDTQRYELRRGGHACPVQPKALDVLAYLVVHRSRVVLKSELLERVWRGVRVTENALAQAVCNARDALGDLGGKAIVSVPRRGYRFALPVNERRPVNDGLVVRVSACGHGPLATFRSLLERVVHDVPGARAAGVPLEHAILDASDERGLADVVLAFFEEPLPRGLTLVIDGLEHADVASILLFAVVATSPNADVTITATHEGDAATSASALRRLVAAHSSSNA
jgi:DNA-binding winged helix-turn-helix (wHTH) protein